MPPWALSDQRELSQSSIHPLQHRRLAETSRRRQPRYPPPSATALVFPLFGAQLALRLCDRSRLLHLNARRSRQQRQTRLLQFRNKLHTPIHHPPHPLPKRITSRHRILGPQQQTTTQTWTKPPLQHLSRRRRRTSSNTHRCRTTKR